MPQTPSVKTDNGVAQITFYSDVGGWDGINAAGFAAALESAGEVEHRNLTVINLTTGDEFRLIGHCLSGSGPAGSKTHNQAGRTAHEILDNHKHSFEKVSLSCSAEKPPVTSASGGGLCVVDVVGG